MMSLLINSKWTDLRFQLHLLNNAFCWRKQLSIETNGYSHWKLLNIANYLKISLWLRELWVSLMAVVKNPPANAGDARAAGLIPGPGRSPGVGNGNTLQYSFLENSMDRGSWQATIHRVPKSQMTEDFTCMQHGIVLVRRHSLRFSQAELAPDINSVNIF